MTNQVSTAKFGFNPETRTFSAELSDLGPDFQLDRIFDDACDEGLVLVSARTGQECSFYVERTERRDGDLLAYYLKAVPAHQRRRGQIKGNNDLRVVLFND